MKRKIVRVVACGTLLFGLLVALPQRAASQTVSAVPQLDLNRYMGRWFVISRYLNKKEKRCISDNLVLYALGDKPRSFQIGTFCTIKSGSPDDLNNTGKMDKLGTGKLKLSRLVIFSTKYWVLATGPDYDWALVGNPNHKTLWVLSRTETLSPEVYAGIQKTASAEGFNPAKLMPVTRTLTFSVMSTK